MILVLRAGAFAATLVIDGTAIAQDFPTRPIRALDGFPPGGAADVVMRIVTPRLSEVLGQSVVLENRPGATGTIAAAVVAKAPPDGYTLLIGLSSMMAISPALFKNLPYDSLRDLVAVGQIVTYANLLAVHPSVPANSVRELIALAKARPGKLNYASGGGGTSNHLAAELFKMTAGIDMAHVPYKGGGPAVIALIGGEVDLQFSTLPSVVPHVRSGRLKALAVSGLERSAALPRVPTVSESGLPGFEVVSWAGLLAPAATPRQVITRLNTATNEVLRAPEIRQRIADLATDVVTGTPDQFAALIRKDTERWAMVVKASGAKID